MPLPVQGIDFPSVAFHHTSFRDSAMLKKMLDHTTRGTDPLILSIRLLDIHCQAMNSEVGIEGASNELSIEFIDVSSGCGGGNLVQVETMATSVLRWKGNVQKTMHWIERKLWTTSTMPSRLEKQWKMAGELQTRNHATVGFPAQFDRTRPWSVQWIRWKSTDNVGK